MPVIRCPWIIRATAPLGVAAALLAANGAWSQQPPAQPATPPAPTQTAAQALSQPPTPAKSGTFLAEELEQMVAPIALYPDPLLAQVLMSSTYPLEIVEAARWRKANPDVTGDAVEAALTDHDWDPSVKSIATFPDVLAMMDEKLDWTQKLGDAFLAQQAEVMAAVQRLRAKAKAEGTLMSSKEQTVTEEPAAPPPAAPAADAAAAAAPAAAPAAAAPATQTTTIIKIEPADPEIVYVPTYNPTIVYGAWPYPAYPPYYYYPPMYPPGAAFFSFTAGVIIGGAFWGNCNWGSSDIDINVNRNTNINTGGNRNNVGNNAGNRGGVGNNAAGVSDNAANRGGAGNNAAGVSNNAAGGGKWQHDSSHRKGAQYRDSATQNKFGKGQNANTAQSREQFRGRAEQGRQDIAAGGATRDLAGNQLGGQGGGNRAGTQPAGGNRAGTQPATGNRAGQGGAAAGTRPTQPSSANRASTANRSGSEAFRSSSSGSSTRSASQRGYSSRSSGGFSGGGMSRGGGGMRGGGGRR